VNAAALLDELTAAGVSLTRSGDDLHYRTHPGVSIAPYCDQIITYKPALLTLLALQEEIVRTAGAARDAFDRAAYDVLWERWHTLHDEEICP
jgi:hypothetical protein